LRLTTTVKYTSTIRYVTGVCKRVGSRCRRNTAASDGALCESGRKGL